MPGRRTLSVLVVAALLAATAFLALLAYRTERDDAREENQARAEQAAVILRQNITLLTVGLRGAGALVTDDGMIDPRRFNDFSRDVLRRSPFRRLFWATPVDAAERSEFEARIGRTITRLGAGGRLVPVRPGTVREFLPIALVHPNTRQRRRNLGFDLFSDARRAATAQAAIEAVEPRISAPLRLRRPAESGAIAFDPVPLPGGTDLAGVLGTRIAGVDVIRSIGEQLGDVRGVTIRDAGRLVAGEPLEGDSVSSAIQVLGRQWRVTVPATNATDLVPAIAFGGAGLALTLSAAGLLLFAARRERDLTNRRLEAERLAARESLQVRITEAIEREMGGDARLASLARQLVPAVADVCIVHEATPGGGARRVGVAATDPGLDQALDALPDPPETSPVRAAIASRQPVLYTRLTQGRRADASGAQGAEGEGEHRVSAEQRLRVEEVSSMVVPLVAGERVLGAVSLIILESSGRPPLTRDDLAFAMEVATHAAVALDNARLYERQRDIAGVLQTALVPRALPQVAGMEVAGRHRAGMAGSEVGGDFYDLFEAGGHWMAVLGDVCGKGPEAAALTALVRHTLRATARLGPAGAVARVHEAIKGSGESTYCTLCCAELRPTGAGIDVSVTTAGHPEPWLVSASGSTERLRVTGPLVGALDDPAYSAQEIHLAPGELLFLYSDGVPEARRNGRFFGDERLGALLRDLVGQEPHEMLARIEQEVLAFVGGNPHDDVAMLALRSE